MAGSKSDRDVLESNTRKECSLIDSHAAYRLVGANARQQSFLEKQLNCHTREFNRERRATERLTRSLVKSASQVERVATPGFQDFGLPATRPGSKRSSSLELRIARRQQQLQLLRSSNTLSPPPTRAKTRNRSGSLPVSRKICPSHAAVKRRSSLCVPLREPVECVDDVQGVQFLHVANKLDGNSTFHNSTTANAADSDSASLRPQSPVSPLAKMFSSRPEKSSQRLAKTVTPAVNADSGDRMKSLVEGVQNASMASVKRDALELGQLQKLMSSLTVEDSSPASMKHPGFVLEKRNSDVIKHQAQSSVDKKY